MTVILKSPEESLISFETYEKYILPVLKQQTVPTVILYHLKEESIRIRTKVNGFFFITYIDKSVIISMYKDKELEVGIEPPTEISESDLLNKFNQDFMDNRGIPELE